MLNVVLPRLEPMKFLEVVPGNSRRPEAENGLLFPSRRAATAGFTVMDGPAVAARAGRHGVVSRCRAAQAVRRCPRSGRGPRGGPPASPAPNAGRPAGAWR